jgi:hypothetical protein
VQKQESSNKVDKSEGCEEDNTKKRQVVGRCNEVVASMYDGHSNTTKLKKVSGHLLVP